MAADPREMRCDVCGGQIDCLPVPTADLVGEPWHLCLECAKDLEDELRVKRGHNQAAKP